MRGQALLEMAIITPILLLLIIGGMFVGLALIDHYRLTHAATQAALVAADDRRCTKARSTLIEIYGRKPSTFDCQIRSRTVEIDASHDTGLVIPIINLRLINGVSERAEIMR